MSKKFSEMEPLIMHELKRLSSAYDELQERMDKRDEKLLEALTILKTEVSSFKARFAVWGAVGGFISLIVVAVIQEFISKGMK